MILGRGRFTPVTGRRGPPVIISGMGQQRTFMHCANLEKNNGTHLHGTHVQWRSRPQHQ
jgi:hypothetical protein